MLVEYGEIKSYFDEYYFSAIEIFNRYKRFGLPFSGGWAEQPAYLLDVIDLFESTIEAHTRHEREKAEKKNGNSRRT